jgi:hypothetical protein
VGLRIDHSRETAVIETEQRCCEEAVQRSCGGKLGSATIPGATLTSSRPRTIRGRVALFRALVSRRRTAEGITAASFAFVGIFRKGATNSRNRGRVRTIFARPIH